MLKHWVKVTILKASVITIGLLLASCSLPNVPLQSYLKKDSLNGIRKVAIIVSSNPINVSYSMNRQGIASTILVGVFGYIAEASARYDSDKELATKLQEYINPILIEEIFVKSLTCNLSNSGYFQKIDYLKNKSVNQQLVSEGYDALINLSLHLISLDLVSDDKFRLSVHTKAKMEAFNSGVTLWEREEIVSASKEISIDYFKEHGMEELDVLLKKNANNLSNDFITLKYLN